MASTTPPPQLPTPAAGSAIALTDRFYVSESCLENSAFYDISTTNGLGKDDNFYVQGPRGFQTACFPQSYQASTDMWYSPGICPSRYTSACDTKDVAGGVTQTRVTCCPEIGVFTCFPESEMAKESNFPWHSTFGCVSYFSSDLSVPVKQKIGYTKGTDVKSDVTIRPPGDKPGTVNAFSVQVAYQSGDSVSPKGGDGGSGNGNGNDDDTTTTTNGLTTAAAIGIGVGVGIAAILILIACFFLWRRRRYYPRLSSSSSANQDIQQQRQQQQDMFLPRGTSSSNTTTPYCGGSSPEYTQATTSLATPHTHQKDFIGEHHKLYNAAEAPATTLDGAKPVSELPSGPGTEIPSELGAVQEEEGMTRTMMTEVLQEPHQQQQQHTMPPVEMLGDVPSASTPPPPPPRSG